MTGRPGRLTTRRYQRVPASVHCTVCPWLDHINGDARQLEQKAQAHAVITGHEVRVTQSSKVIIRPLSLAGVS